MIDAQTILASAASDFLEGLALPIGLVLCVLVALVIAKAVEHSGASDSEEADESGGEIGELLLSLARLVVFVLLVAGVLAVVQGCLG